MFDRIIFVFVVKIQKYREKNHKIVKVYPS